MSSYSVGTGSQAISGTASVTLANAAVTLVIIRPPTTAGGMGVNIMRLWANQKGTATSAQYEIIYGTKVTAFGTYVSATPKPDRIDGPASVISGGTAGAQGTAGINASAEGAGTVTGIGGDNFNNLNGYLWTPNPKEVITLANNSASGFVLALPVAVGSLTNWHFGVNYEEV